MSTNATQIIGVSCFAATGFLCAVAALRTEKQQARHWFTVAAVFAALSMEVALGLRYSVHNLFSDLLRATGRYEDRQGLQVLVLLLCVLVTIAIAAVLRKRLTQSIVATNGASLAATVAVSLIVIEGISLHGIDALFWHNIAGVLVIGWLWGSLAMLGAFAAIRTCTMSRPSI